MASQQDCRIRGQIAEVELQRSAAGFQGKPFFALHSVHATAEFLRLSSLRSGLARDDKGMSLLRFGRNHFAIMGRRAAPKRPASLPSRARVMIVLRPLPGSTCAEAPSLPLKASGAVAA